MNEQKYNFIFDNKLFISDVDNDEYTIIQNITNIVKSNKLENDFIRWGNRNIKNPYEQQNDFFNFISNKLHNFSLSIDKIIKYLNMSLFIFKYDFELFYSIRSSPVFMDIPFINSYALKINLEKYVYVKYWLGLQEIQNINLHESFIVLVISALTSIINLRLVNEFKGYTKSFKNFVFDSNDWLSFYQIQNGLLLNSNIFDAEYVLNFVRNILNKKINLLIN